MFFYSGGSGLSLGSKHALPSDASVISLPNISVPVACYNPTQAFVGLSKDLRPFVWQRIIPNRILGLIGRVKDMFFTCGYVILCEFSDWLCI